MADEQKDGPIGEHLQSWEIVNLAQEVGDPPPAAIAWISLNGHVFETDVDELEKIATEAKAARKRSRNGLGGRGGSSITAKELSRAARQRLLSFPSEEHEAEAKTGPARRTAAAGGKS